MYFTRRETPIVILFGLVGEKINPTDFTISQINWQISNNMKNFPLRQVFHFKCNLLIRCANSEKSGQRVITSLKPSEKKKSFQYLSSKEFMHFNLHNSAFFLSDKLLHASSITRRFWHHKIYHRLTFVLTKLKMNNVSVFVLVWKKYEYHSQVVSESENRNIRLESEVTRVFYRWCFYSIYKPERYSWSRYSENADIRIADNERRVNNLPTLRRRICNNKWTIKLIVSDKNSSTG